MDTPSVINPPSRTGALRGRLAERSAIVVVSVIAFVAWSNHAPAITAAAPILQVHTSADGVVVDSPTVTVTGRGIAKGTPDTLTVPMGVTTTAEHASDALSQCNQLTDKLLSTLRGAGANDKDLATSNLNINPQYSYDGRHITGYTVTENVTVTLHDLARAGGMLDTAARAVGDSVRINGMSLSISDDSALLATARGAAVTDAKTKAQAMASGAGVHLGAVRSITEAGSGGPQVVPMYAGRGLSDAASAVPVAPGQQELAIEVTVVYVLGA